jgi:glycosyltransferase involved in cell wall biosynthesis
MASGIPVVQPALGAFPEIIHLSGGGIIYEPNTPEFLSKAWMELLSDPERLENISQKALDGVRINFNINDHAKEMTEVYNTL